MRSDDSAAAVCKQTDLLFLLFNASDLLKKCNGEKNPLLPPKNPAVGIFAFFGSTNIYPLLGILPCV